MREAAADTAGALAPNLMIALVLVLWCIRIPSPLAVSFPTMQTSFQSKELVPERSSPVQRSQDFSSSFLFTSVLGDLKS
ncbi:hypothetical protein STEG23_008642 [Scotinomys teguina]